MIKKALFVVLFIILTTVIYFFLIYYPQLPIANGYAAKKMCSCIFIANRTQEDIQSDDLAMSPLSLTRTTVDHAHQSVTTSIYGLRSRTAVYRNSLGCILLDGVDDYTADLTIKKSPTSTEELWPKGNNIRYDSLPLDVNIDQLNKAITSSFDKNLTLDSIKTRAVVVVYENQLIAEKYAKGYSSDTELLGWSMAKSITATLIGILAKNKKIDLQDTQLFEDWSQDDRANISLENLLHMQSGLSFEEDYAAISDVTKMLFLSEDISQIPLEQPLIHEPGAHWSYSSGTTNLLSKLILDKIGQHQEYLRFPYDSLFHRIGMNSAVLETDESGLFIGSSYLYATPRDWARFGLLYLNQGNWQGDQIIDSSWVDFVRTPSGHSDGIYGGHFWLNHQHSAYPDVPTDLYSCNGFGGQYVFIVPSKDLVIVRMGLANEPSFNPNGFLRDIIAAFE